MAGTPASAWVAFLPYMTMHRWGTSFFPPALAATFGPALAEMFGPKGILSPEAHPDFSKVKYTPLKDAALRATITEWTIPSPAAPDSAAMPHSVRVDDRNGMAVWWADYDAANNNVVRFDPKTKTFKLFPVPIPNALAHTGAVLPDGNFMVPFTMTRVRESNGVIEPKSNTTMLGIVSANGHWETFDFPHERPGRPAGGPRIVAVDPVHKDFVWVLAGTEVWHLNVKTRQRRVYQNPVPKAFPARSEGALEEEPGFTKPSSDGYDLVVDSHGTPWVTQIDVATIFHIDPVTGKEQTYHTPEMHSARGIEVADNGIVWFADYYGHQLGRLDPKTGKITLYPLPTRYASPYGITLDRRRGYVWYADTTGNQATRFDPRTGAFVEYPLATRNASIRFMGIDAKGRIWYGGFWTGKLGEIDPGYATTGSFVSAR
jgi:streptogramin lyase